MNNNVITATTERTPMTGAELFIKSRVMRVSDKAMAAEAGMTVMGWKEYAKLIKRWMDKQKVYNMCCDALDASNRPHLKTYVGYVLMEYQKYELVRASMQGVDGIIKQAQQLASQHHCY